MSGGRVPSRGDDEQQDPSPLLTAVTAVPVAEPGTERVGDRRPPIRGRLSGFIARHETAWDLGFGILAVAYLVVGVADDSGSDVSSSVLLVLAGLFLTEFAVRMWDAPSRYAYLRRHWIDLVSAIPLIGGLRSIRLLRLLRLGAALRILALAEEVARARPGGRHSLWYVGPALCVVWLASATAYYGFERGVNRNVRGFGDALYWAFSTATTIGYGAGTPETAGAKVVSGLLILVSVGLVGVVSSRVVVAWLGADDRNESEQLRLRLERIEAQLASTNDVLTRLARHLEPPQTAPMGSVEGAADSAPPVAAADDRPTRADVTGRPLTSRRRARPAHAEARATDSGSGSDPAS